MLSFAEESWFDIRESLTRLTALHWKEMPFDDDIPLSLDHDLYVRLASIGRLHVTTARAGGKLVGYFACFLGRHPHYDVLMASMDVYYLESAHRNAGNGIGLFLAMERLVKARGVRYLLATARLDKDHNASRIFERLGWNRARTVYEKKLGV